MVTLHDIGELAAVQRILSRLPDRDDIMTGAGDDCAVVRIDDSKQDILLTSDPVIEGIHFDSETDPDKIGHKAVGRVLSDIAAMGGMPKWALVNLVAPANTPMEKIDSIYAGALALSGRHDMAIIGGDLSRGPTMELHVLGAGIVPHGSAVLRSGAQPNDVLFVTGSLGASRTQKHLSFEPRVKEGLWLRTRATSMIDISDGLASDAGHIADMSGTGILLQANQVPLSNSASLDNALYDGEDFELLFTIPPEEKEAFQTDWKQTFDLPCCEIGIITDKIGTVETIDPEGNTTVLDRKGFQHFS